MISYANDVFGITGGTGSDVQSDWTETDDTKSAYILHTPTIPVGNMELNSDTVIDDPIYITTLDVDTENNTVTLTTHNNVSRFNVNDIKGTFATNNCIIDAGANNETIQGQNTLEIDLNKTYLEFFRVGTDWKIKYSGVGGVYTDFIPMDHDYTVKHKDHIHADTSGGSFNITLPENPMPNTLVSITDTKSSFNVNSLFILRNGSTIMGLDEDLEIDIQDRLYKFVFLNGDWVVAS